MKKVMIVALSALLVTTITGCRANQHRHWNDNNFETVGNHQGNGHHGKRHHRDRDGDDNGREESGTGYSKFAGNYTVKFSTGEQGADIHIEDQAVYLNGKEIRDVNAVGDVLTFRDGYASYTIRKHGRSDWKDEDVGSSGTIHKN